MESVRWSAGRHSFLAQTSGTAALAFIAATSDPPETLMRLRGELMSYVDTTQAPTGLVEMALGIALVPEGTGTTVLWSPIADGDAPWWFYERWSLGYEEYVTDVIDAPGITSFRKTIDLKGMRIIRPDVEVQIVIENATIGAALAANTVLTSRVLIGAT